MAIRRTTHDDAIARSAPPELTPGANPLGLPQRFELMITLQVLSDVPGKVAATKTFTCEASLTADGPFSERRTNYCEDQVGSEKRGHIADFYLPRHQAVRYDAFTGQMFERTPQGVVEHRLSVVRRSVRRPGTPA